MSAPFMPWWLEDQTEVCVFCRQLYACGLECWCVVCQCAVCPLCAMATTGRDPDGGVAWNCPECHEQAQHEGAA